MANKINLKTAIDEAITEILESVDSYIVGIIDELTDFGTPRQLIKKPVDQWTERDIQLLELIYHKDDEAEPCLLCKTLADHSIKKMYEEEGKVG